MRFVFCFVIIIRFKKPINIFIGYDTRERVAANILQDKGAKVLGDGKPRIGAHGKPVIFLHPKEFFGTLIELEQR